MRKALGDSLKLKRLVFLCLKLAITVFGIFEGTNTFIRKIDNQAFELYVEEHVGNH